MKLKFKIQPYQTAAVESVVDCFTGQAKLSDQSVLGYRIDSGIDKKGTGEQARNLPLDGFKNADIQLSEEQLLQNVVGVQKRQNLPLSEALDDFSVWDGRKSKSTPAPAAYKRPAKEACSVHLDVEMETGTGKTYCYIKTMFELNKEYGWSKFIVVVPSVAIREGVYQSLDITADHFLETYGKKARSFIYDSKQLHRLENFSSDAGINVMVINMQAFNATGKDNRRIYEELDDFQSRKPIDVISKNRPILILDEPQKMEGKKTLTALAKFNPLMILRYSATHKTTHNKIHRLDALDAYNEKLVKKIEVRGISVNGLTGSNAYLYLEGVETSKSNPVARMEIEIQQKSGKIVRKVKVLRKGDDLFSKSEGMEQYKNGFVIAQINATQDTVEFTNGVTLTSGEVTQDITETARRHIQIREAIRAHLDKEQMLFAQGIKVLTLFFIDEVAKYRDYSQADEKGEYARIFEEVYTELTAKRLGELVLSDDEYRDYLKGIPQDKTHNGYFAVDKQKKLVDPKVKLRGEDKGLSDDVSAYDLILKDKARLLSFEEPVRFIFSHSALREGWDNPNVFVMCMLKHSDNAVSRRQEVGRGLRLSVNQHGERMDHPATVHDINVLTVVASESYQDFISTLQKEMVADLSARPQKADEGYFTGKVITTTDGQPLEITPAMAKHIYRYLLKHDYTDDDDRIAEPYHQAKKEDTRARLPETLQPYEEEIFKLIDSVFSASQMQLPGDGRKPKKNRLNENFQKKEFQALWQHINRKAVYQVDFDSEELIPKAITALDKELHITPLQYSIQSGRQKLSINDDELKKGDSFKLERTELEHHKTSIHSHVKYDLLGKLAENVQLTRQTVGRILAGMATVKFKLFPQNPEHFIAECSRLIKEQKAAMIIEHLSYDPINEVHETEIFTAGNSKQDFSNAGDKLKKHIYDYVVTDSNTERQFVGTLDTSKEVVVYAKLPKGFFIPTPVGDYNPDWAIAFQEDKVKHIYFIAETKGSLSTLDLRGIENAKIDCARKFFKKMNQDLEDRHVKYDVATGYSDLMRLVNE